MPHLTQRVQSLIIILINTAAEAVRSLGIVFRSPSALAAEILFLRKQPAFYQERQNPPRRLTEALTLLRWSLENKTLNESAT